MILLSPDPDAITAGAVGALLGALVFFWIPPVGAAMGALARVAARRGSRGALPPRLAPVSLRSPMMVSRDWSSLEDMLCGCLEVLGVVEMMNLR